MPDIGLSNNGLDEQHLKIKEIIESSDSLKKKTKVMTGFAIDKFPTYYFGIENMANDLRKTINMANEIIMNPRNFILTSLEQRGIKGDNIQGIADFKSEIIQNLETSKLKYEDIGLETLQDAFFADTFGAIYLRMRENPKYTNTDSLKYLTNFQNNTDYILQHVKEIPSLVKSATHYINQLQV